MRRIAAQPTNTGGRNNTTTAAKSTVPGPRGIEKAPTCRRSTQVTLTLSNRRAAVSQRGDLPPTVWRGARRGTLGRARPQARRGAGPARAATGREARGGEGCVARRLTRGCWAHRPRCDSFWIEPQPPSGSRWGSTETSGWAIGRPRSPTSVASIAGAAVPIKPRVASVARAPSRGRRVWVHGIEGRTRPRRTHDGVE